MKDITRTEAAERASVIQDCHYEIFLDLTKRERFFSRTCVKFNSKPGANTFIDALANAIESVSLNGIPLDIKSVFDGSRIALENLETDNEVVVEGYFEYTNTGEGMHEFTDPV
ncbi:MAG: aminopeptidase N, partial [Tropheryma whipplei]|nr:aminopeptidase N [Tropheryma whipplei]